MPLPPGNTLGPYQIDAPLGAGGMGEVYKATDIRLERTVAIKVLPEHVAADPDLKQRFEREARTVAALNHPHICTLHDIGSQDGIDFLVMEYLDGQTLAQRLEKGALPLDQALQIAIDIADALDKANRKGITHRDLKPGNIMLTKAGAKLLDFGLAKLRKTEPNLATIFSATMSLSEPLTGQGTILGTVQYMAPEQLEGGEADQRTDIFAFGAVVYEMVTGRKAFEGKSQASLIAAILEREPPAISELQAMSPLSLDPIIKTCLAKDPEERWQSLGDVGLQLRGLGGSKVEVEVSTRTTSANRVTPVVPIAVSLLAGTALVSLAMWAFDSGASESIGVVRFRLNEPGMTLAGITADFAFSADGSRIVYRGQLENGTGDQLHLRSLDRTGGTPLRGTEGALFDFAMSPDGEWVVFEREFGHLEKISIFGGRAETIVHMPHSVAGKMWGADDQIIFGAISAGLKRVQASGGPVEELTTLNAERGEVAHALPSPVSDASALLFVVVRGAGLSSFELAALSLETMEVSYLGLAGTSPHYLSTGHLVYVADDQSLRAVPFDSDQLSVLGSPVTLIAQIMVTQGGSANLDISDNGHLVYMSAEAAEQYELVWIDRAGDVVGTVREDLNRPWTSLSPEGDRVALTVDESIWVVDLQSGYSTRLTDEGVNLNPIWTPDGRQVTFASNRTGPFNLYSGPADLRSSPERLLEAELSVIPGSWSPDGQTLLYYEIHPDTLRDIWVLPVGGTPSPFLATEFNETSPRLSPDGQWVVYTSNESGENRVYVRAYPMGTPVIPISVGPGEQPLWSRRGDELFYRDGDQMLAVAIETTGDLQVGSTSVVFEQSFVLDPANSGVPTYEVSRDGQRFLMVQEAQTGDEGLSVVLNWFEELKARVPTN